MRPGFSFKYLRNRLRHDSFLKLTSDALDRCGIILRPYYLVLEGRFGQSIVELESGFDDYQTGFLDECDMAEIARIPGRYTTEDELLKRLEDGMLCFALKQHGELAAFNWIDLDRCHFTAHTFPLKDDEAYLFDAWTMVPFRGKKVGPYLRYQTYKELERRGRYRSFSISECVNTSAIKFKEKLNARHLELALYVNLFNKRQFQFSLRKYE
ncbi:MAG: hypothetical protein PVJ33_01385 [Lysobacterales bacterium]